MNAEFGTAAPSSILDILPFQANSGSRSLYTRTLYFHMSMSALSGQPNTGRHGQGRLQDVKRLIINNESIRYQNARILCSKQRVQAKIPQNAHVLFASKP